MNKIDQMRLKQVLEQSDKAQDILLDEIKTKVTKLDKRHLVRLCTHVAGLAEKLMKEHEG